TAPAPQATDTSHSPLGGRTTRNTRLYGAGAGGASDSAGISAVAAGRGVEGADRADGVGGALGRSPGLERSGLTVADGARDAGGRPAGGCSRFAGRGSLRACGSISGGCTASWFAAIMALKVPVAADHSGLGAGSTNTDDASVLAGSNSSASSGMASSSLTAGGGGRGGASFSRASPGAEATDVGVLVGLSSTEGCVGALSGGPSGSWRSSVSRASALNTLEQRPQRT